MGCRGGSQVSVTLSLRTPPGGKVRLRGAEGAAGRAKVANYILKDKIQTQNGSAQTVPTVMGFAQVILNRFTPHCVIGTIPFYYII